LSVRVAEFPNNDFPRLRKLKFPVLGRGVKQRYWHFNSIVVVYNGLNIIPKLIRIIVPPGFTYII
jgi:hypothetical protein